MFIGGFFEAYQPLAQLRNLYAALSSSILDFNSQVVSLIVVAINVVVLLGNSESVVVVNNIFVLGVIDMVAVLIVDSYTVGERHGRSGGLVVIVILAIGVCLATSGISNAVFIVLANIVTIRYQNFF